MKDPYLDKNDVLFNKLNIVDNEELNQAEADIGFLKLISVDDVNVDFFNTDLIKKIHKHIFEDIYDWAGEYRSVPLYKEEAVIPMISIKYSDPQNIEKDLERELQRLNSVSWQNLDIKEIAYNFARNIAIVWRVHPFRDGNTRTMLSFAYLYAKEHGFPFDMETFTQGLSRIYDDEGRIRRYSVRDKFVLASLDEKDYPEVEHLAMVFEVAIRKYSEIHKGNRK